ncbi:MAG: VCBS repeat-containing protein, partial [Proteobacteria bacterium]|nr:VCBS repeat-containing protein [Pseudomonadota bacterium]
PFTVLVQDVNGTTVSGATNAITIALDPSTPNGVQLFGTLQVNAVNGVATFSDVHVTPAGAGFVLAASATGLTADTSATFEVNPLAAAFATLRRDFTEGRAQNPTLWFNEDVDTLTHGHFTNSGHLDLVATNSSGTAVTVLLGNGDGTYQAPISLPLVNQHPVDVVAADFNGDGFDDLAVGCDHGFPAAVNILLSNGNGTFKGVTTVSTWVRPTALAVADLGDKHQSLVIAGRDGNQSGNPPDASVLVLRGNGDGTFATNAPVLTFAPYSVRDVVVGPLTPSGNVDIVAVGQGGISVMLGNGDTTFAAPMNYAVTGLSPVCAALAPQQQGAPLSLYVADSAKHVSVLAGNGDGTFNAPQNQSIPGSPSFNIAVGDFDGDKVADVVVGTQSAGVGSVVVVQGNIANGFSGQTQSIPASGQSAKSVVMADLNQDGKVDLASLSGRTVSYPGGPSTTHPLLGGVVSVFLNPVSGPASVVVPSDTNDQASADLDGDGAPEIVTTYPANSLVSVLHGNTDGSFSALANISLPGAAPSGVKVGDFNNDGKPDLAVQLSLQSKVAVLLGNGNGTFQAPQNLSVPVSGN